MKELPRYYTNLSPSLTNIFELFSIDFAGPFLKSSKGYQSFLICVEHLTNWPLAKEIKVTTAEKDIKVVEEEILHPFGLPTTVMSDNSSCFLAMEWKKFVEENGITWKTVLLYASMSNGKEERIVEMLKKSIGRMLKNG